jgi:hypothetical protein
MPGVSVAFVIGFSVALLATSPASLAAWEASLGDAHGLAREGTHPRTSTPALAHTLVVPSRAMEGSHGEVAFAPLRVVESWQDSSAGSLRPWRGNVAGTEGLAARRGLSDRSALRVLFALVALVACGVAVVNWRNRR